MLHVATGQSHQRSTPQAVEEAAGRAMAGARLSKADLVLVFFTVDHLAQPQELLSGLRNICGTERIVGCSGTGVLTEKGEIEGQAGLVVMVIASDRIQGEPFLVPGSGGSEQVVDPIARGLRAGEDSLVAIFPDPHQSQPGEVLQAIRQGFGDLPVVGAGCSENGTRGKTFQLEGERIVSGALSGLTLSGSFTTSIEVTQGCQPISEPMVITKARENFIFEIDHRPAVEVFTGVIKGPLREDLRRALAYVFVGLPSGPEGSTIHPGQYLVRNIIGLDEEKGILAVGEKVREGEPVIFTLREAQRARQDLEQMLQRQVDKLDGKTPQFGLYFNCCARGTSLYGFPGMDTAYIHRSLGDFPLIGFFGSYELGPVGRINQLLTYTGVLALINEKQTES